MLGARVIEAGRNLGFSAANNRALAVATGDYVAFVNPDVSVQPQDLDALARVINATGGLVAPQLLNDDGSAQPNGRGMPLLAHKIRNRLQGADAGNGYRIVAMDDESTFAFWVIGAALAMTRETAEALGGWNERFFLYYEDKDICIRAWQHRLPTVLSGSVRWRHGWARDTTRLRLRPWLHEIASLIKFYGAYPEFLVGGRLAQRRHPLATAQTGERAVIA